MVKTREIRQHKPISPYLLDKLPDTPKLIASFSSQIKSRCQVHSKPRLGKSSTVLKPKPSTTANSRVGNKQSRQGKNQQDPSAFLKSPRKKIKTNNLPDSGIMGKKRKFLEIQTNLGKDCGGSLMGSYDRDSKQDDEFSTASNSLVLGLSADGVVAAPIQPQEDQ